MIRLYAIAITLIAVIAFNNSAIAQTEIPFPNSYFDFEGDDNSILDTGMAENNGEIVTDGTDGPIRAKDGITSTGADADGCMEMKGGSKSYIKIPYDKYLNSSSYTIAMWIKYTKNTDWGGYLFWNEGEVFPPVADEKRIDVWTYGKVNEEKQGWICQFDLDTDDEDEKFKQLKGTTAEFGSNFLEDDTWHLFSMVLKDETEVTIYIDGQVLLNEVFDAKVVVSEKEADLWIGKRPPEDNAGLQALIDRIRIWDTALTDDQIAAIYASEGPGGGNEAKVAWKRVGVSSHLINSKLNNYPNPFSGKTTIGFNLKSNSNVEISVYNLNGRKVQTIANSQMNSGQHKINFDANNLPKGMYTYKLITEEGSSANKMIIQ